MMAKMGLFFSASLCRRRRHAATLLYYEFSQWGERISEEEFLF
jgi:hypothetical protein